MKVAVFSARSYDREFLSRANEEYGHELVFFDAHLRAETSPLAFGFPGVCIFVNDTVDAVVAGRLKEGGTRLLALRSAGFNHVDIPAVVEQGIKVVRVPAYSPHAVAEHTVALLLAVDRKIHRAYQRVREGNFVLDGLLGFDLHGKTAGIIGTGKIGTEVCRILAGFGCRLLAYDLRPNPVCVDLGVRYAALDELYAESHIVTLHCPLTPKTHHLVDDRALARMKDGVVLINTSRGAVIDTRAVIEALKSGKLGALAIDVYEEEGDLFFQDLSDKVIQDDVFARLLTFPNVLVTAHQAFFTREALENIAHTTLRNIADFEAGRPLENEVTLEHWAA